MSSYRVQSLFGVPLVLSSEHHRELLDELAAYAKRIGDPAIDLHDPHDRRRYLEFLEEITSPIKRESTVRQLIAKVDPSADPPSSPFADELFYHVEARRWILSREGVEVFQFLTEQPNGDEHPVSIPMESVAAMAVRVAVGYRQTSCARLDKVSALLNGEAGPLLAPSVASLFLLLVNRTTDQSRALPRYPRERHQLVDVARAFREGVLEIGRLIKPDLKPPDLIREWEVGGYAMSEINRRLLPPGLADTDLGDETGRHHKAVYIDPDSVDDAVHLLGFELKRRFGDSETVGSFLDDALTVYAKLVRPTLATAGLAHERPMVTNQYRQSVLQVVTGDSPLLTDS